MLQRRDGAYLLPEEGYDELRARFESAFWYYASQGFILSGYVGCQSFSRQRAGDTAFSGRLPFEPVPVEQQRQALELINTYVFAADAFQFSPDLINPLAPDRWFHWGSFPVIAPLQYPIYDQVSFLQGFALIDLFSSDRLSRLQSASLRNSGDEILGLPELFSTLQQDIWQELSGDGDKANISTLRRGLQRHHLDILSGLVLQNPSQPSSFLELIVALETLYAPEDARVLARYQLRQLAGEIQASVDRHGALDISTQAHLEDSRDRIQQILNAQRIAG